jgi:hypothetical protein
MGSLSKQKGKRVEREAAKALNLVLGVEARRSVQYCGGAGDADLTTTLDGVHFEVKSRAAHSCLRFYEQAAKDAEKPGDIPVVLLRENGDTDFYVLVALSDLRALSRRVSSLEETVDH